MNEECDCFCHNSDGQMKHVVACCFKCPNCLRSIKPFNYDGHIKNCKASSDVFSVVPQKKD